VPDSISAVQRLSWLGGEVSPPVNDGLVVVLAVIGAGRVVVAVLIAVLIAVLVAVLSPAASRGVPHPASATTASAVTAQSLLCRATPSPPRRIRAPPWGR
jgi:hypothetical protein